MSLANWIRKISGRAGKASRSKRGAGSHVHTRANKRAASKALRRSQEDFEDQIAGDDLVDRYLGNPNAQKAHLWEGMGQAKSEMLRQAALARGFPIEDIHLEEVDPTFWQDHHLDIPDELKEEEI